MRIIVTTMLLAGAIASTALADDSDFQWQGQLTPGQLIEVRGVFGAIRAAGGSEDTGASELGKLHRQGADAARRRMDQDRFTLF